MGVAASYAQQGFGVYPDPATSTITISRLEAGQSVSILNSLGKIVFSGKASSEIMQIEFEAMAPGIYLIISGNRATKFIKN